MVDRFNDPMDPASWPYVWDDEMEKFHKELVVSLEQMKVMAKQEIALIIKTKKDLEQLSERIENARTMMSIFMGQNEPQDPFNKHASWYIVNLEILFNGTECHFESMIEFCNDQLGKLKDFKEQWTGELRDRVQVFQQLHPDGMPFDYGN